MVRIGIHASKGRILLIIKSIRVGLLKRLREKAKKMAANGSNCADVLKKIKAIESGNDQLYKSESADILN